MLVLEEIKEQTLLQKCVRHMGSQLDDQNDRTLRRWWKFQAGRAAGLTASLLASPDADWPGVIAQHRAHRHPWYDQLAQEASLEEFAAYLLENQNFPGPLPLVERALQVQICNEGRAALLHNISDEHSPIPHAQLMRRLIGAVRAKAGDNLLLESFTSLVHVNLILYYGYYCDPWVLVGELYATEVMAYHRMAQMDAGLVRLGIDAGELEYIHVHLVCDEERARDWFDGVITPSVRINPALRVFIAEGIAACLDTSARYLDDLCIRQIQRAQRGCTALGAQINWAENPR